MSTTLRCWIAGIGLALSVLVLAAGADPRDMGPRLLPFLLVLVAHAWVIAVTERISSDRGGVEIKRFPLGPRLLRTSPGLLLHHLVFIAAYGLVTNDWKSATIAGAMLALVTVDLTRGFLPYLIPALAAVYALLTMKEFHTFGDLLETAKGWGSAVMWLGIWTVLLTGTLSRTDAGPPLKFKGKVVTTLAALPSYVGAIVIFTLPRFVGRYPDLYAVGLVLLAGGLVQSMLMTALSSTAELTERLPSQMAPVKGYDVGMALMPLLMPVLGCFSLGLLELGGGREAAVQPQAWWGILTLVLVVPAIPAAALVGAALDRVDRRTPSRVPVLVATLALVGWFVGGPAAMGWMYGESGLVTTLHERFWLPNVGNPAIAGAVEQGSLAGPLFAGQLSLYEVPVTDLVRAVTLMLLGTALLCARLLRHSARGLRGPGWLLPALAVTVQAGLSWVLLPRLGAVGMPLAVAAACAVVLLVDLVKGTAEIEEEDNAMDFEAMDAEREFDAPEAVAEEISETEPAYELGLDPRMLDLAMDNEAPPPREQGPSIYDDDLLDGFDPLDTPDDR